MHNYMWRKFLSTTAVFYARKLRIGHRQWTTQPKDQLGQTIESTTNANYKMSPWHAGDEVMSSQSLEEYLESVDNLLPVTDTPTRRASLPKFNSPAAKKLSFSEFDDVDAVNKNKQPTDVKHINVNQNFVDEVRTDVRMTPRRSKHNHLSNKKSVSKFSDPAVVRQIVQDLNVDRIQPVVQKKSYNLATYVNQSEVLSSLVKLKVDLSKIESSPEVSEHLVKMKSTGDLEPYILFLRRNGVSETDVGNCITRNPSIFLESVDDLDIRINYLQSKRFSKEAIGRIVCKAPQVLSVETIETDTKLGFIQRNFALSGDEVRTVITRCPKLIVWSSDKIKEIKFTLKKFLGFSELEMKSMIIAEPKVYLTGKHALIKRFDYLHNVVALSHQDILVWPRILRTRINIVRQRYLFLRHLNRDQFDPQKENYVSVKALGSGRDSEFCENVAKVATAQFNLFLKTL